MNETLQLIENRKSVRAYEPRPLEPGQRDAIVHAALRAPTAGNMMLYSILEIRDPAIKDRLAVTCDNQPFIAKAPLVLVFLRKFATDFMAEMNRSVRELLAPWAPGPDQEPCPSLSDEIPAERVD